MIAAVNFCGDDEVLVVPSEDEADSFEAPTVPLPANKFEQLIGALNASSPPAHPEQVRKTLQEQMACYESRTSNEVITYATNPIAFWSNRAKNIDDQLHELAVTALDIITCPVAEVYIHLRTCLNVDILDDIFCCIWNKDNVPNLNGKSV